MGTLPVDYLPLDIIGCNMRMQYDVRENYGIYNRN